MKKMLRASFLLAGMMFLNPNFSSAATLAVNVNDLELIMPDTVWSYQFEFDITGPSTGVAVTFNTTNQHLWEVVPGFKLTNWNLNNNVVANRLIVLGDEKDYGARAPLVNGNLFNVNYSDNAILSLNFISFLSSSDLVSVIPMNANQLVFGAGEHQLNLSPVPVPAAVWLLGSGLAGLVALKRKRD